MFRESRVLSEAGELEKHTSPLRRSSLRSLKTFKFAPIKRSICIGEPGPVLIILGTILRATFADPRSAESTSPLIGLESAATGPWGGGGVAGQGPRKAYFPGNLWKQLRQFPDFASRELLTLFVAAQERFGEHKTFQGFVRSCIFVRVGSRIRELSRDIDSSVRRVNWG